VHYPHSIPLYNDTLRGISKLLSRRPSALYKDIYCKSLLTFLILLLLAKEISISIGSAAARKMSCTCIIKTKSQGAQFADRLRVLPDKAATLPYQTRSPEIPHLFYTISNDKELLLATRNFFLIHGYIHPPSSCQTRCKGLYYYNPHEANHANHRARPFIPF
jgi:hypothetical protein